VKLCEILQRIKLRLADPAYIDEAKRRGARDAQRECEQRMQAIEEQRAAIWKDRGRRYAACRLDNYQADGDHQRAVLSAVRDFRDSLAEHIAAGTNLILVGPSGTGKDHLLAALFNAAVDLPRRIRWTSGAGLFSSLRDSIGEEVNEEKTLAQWIWACDVLVISDPVPIAGELTNYQRSMLYQIVDTRYNARKPIWATINAATRQEAEQSIGVAIVDRLRDGAVSLACNWKSHRSPLA
jgi:DNA replication protein DnaC